MSVHLERECSARGYERAYVRVPGRTAHFLVLLEPMDTGAARQLRSRPQTLLATPSISARVALPTRISQLIHVKTRKHKV